MQCLNLHQFAWPALGAKWFGDVDNNVQGTPFVSWVAGCPMLPPVLSSVISHSPVWAANFFFFKLLAFIKLLLLIFLIKTKVRS